MRLLQCALERFIILLHAVQSSADGCLFTSIDFRPRLSSPQSSLIAIRKKAKLEGICQEDSLEATRLQCTAVVEATAR
eukprot:814844-Amphidinium_carterae.1